MFIIVHLLFFFFLINYHLWTPQLWKKKLFLIIVVCIFVQNADLLLVLILKI